MEEDFGSMDIHFFDTLESTNLYAQEGIKNKKITSSCIIATNFQTAGKGQRASNWMSNYGENLLFSIVIFHENTAVDEAFYLSKITSLALQEFLSNMTEGQVKIKWPNDLFIGERKVAGILIENNISGNKINSSIIGIGLNVNQSSFEENINATSIFMEEGKTSQLTELLDAIVEKFSKWLEIYKSEEKELISTSYIRHLYAFEKEKLYKDKDGNFKGQIIDVKENGQLVVMKNNGSLMHYDLKEIEFIN